jgi:hypothetical protein
MINKKIILFINILFLATAFFQPAITFAQVEGDINSPSVADANNSLIECTTVDYCDWAYFLQTLNKVKDYGFQLVVAASIILIVYAGVKMVLARENAGERQVAKNIISNVVIGFFLAAAGWLIVSAIVKSLEVQDGFAPQELLQNRGI